MSGPRAALETVAESFDVDVSAKFGGVNFRGFGQKQSIDAGRGKLFAICFDASRIFREVFLWTKLFWIHEYRCNYRRAVLLRALHQRGVPDVQCAHGWHKADDAAFGAGLARGLFHPGDGADGFHRGANSLSFGGDIALAIKMHQVGQDGLSAVLAQHRGDLAAVIAAMIYNVLHGLPQRIAVDPELQRFVFQYPIKIALRQAANEIEQARLEFAPALAKGGNVRILLGIGERGWRATLETFEPNPFCPEDVPERVAHRRKTRAQRLGELLRRERDCRR